MEISAATTVNSFVGSVPVSATGAQTGDKGKVAGTESKKDKVIISESALATKLREKQLVVDANLVLPEHRKSLLTQAKHKINSGYYFSYDITDSLAGKMVNAVA